MKKKIFIYVLFAILLLILACSVLFDLGTNKNNDDLEKITVADTTLTSRTLYRLV